MYAHLNIVKHNTNSPSISRLQILTSNSEVIRINHPRNVYIFRQFFTVMLILRYKPFSIMPGPTVSDHPNQEATPMLYSKRKNRNKPMVMMMAIALSFFPFIAR